MTQLREFVFTIQITKLKIKLQDFEGNWFLIYCCWFFNHTSQCLGLTPALCSGVMILNAQKTIQDAGKQTKVGYMQHTCLKPCSSFLAPPFLIVFFFSASMKYSMIKITKNFCTVVFSEICQKSIHSPISILKLDKHTTPHAY